MPTQVDIRPLWPLRENGGQMSPTSKCCICRTNVANQLDSSPRYSSRVTQCSWDLGKTRNASPDELLRLKTCPQNQQNDSASSWNVTPGSVRGSQASKGWGQRLNWPIALREVQAALAAQRERRGLKAAKDAQAPFPPCVCVVAMNDDQVLILVVDDGHFMVMTTNVLDELCTLLWQFSYGSWRYVVHIVSCTCYVIQSRFGLFDIWSIVYRHDLLGKPSAVRSIFQEVHQHVEEYSYYLLPLGELN